ncbi:MAG: TIGR04211 family SH3 domain-containing protein [Oceanococcus sp.]
MKYWLGLLLLLPICSWAAETVVVKDVLPINVRSGAATSFGIVAAVKSGQRLTVLEKAPGYVKVLTPKGKEGWVLARFVQKEPVAQELLDSALKQKDQAVAQNKEAQTALQQLQASHTELQSKFDSLQIQHQAVSAELQQVSVAAASTLEIQQRNEDLQKQLQVSELAQQKMQEHVDYKSIRRSNMLLGGGIMLAGLLVGLIAPLLRPQRSSWA